MIRIFSTAALAAASFALIATPLLADALPGSPSGVLLVAQNHDDHATHADEHTDHSDHDVVHAPEVTFGDLTLGGAFTRATLPNAPVAGGYLTITNSGDTAERLIDAESPFSPDVQIHEMSIVNDVMEMRQLPDGIEIPAGETVTLAPGGLHLMFMKLVQPFVEGETIPVTLVFENAGRVDIDLAVGSFGASGHDDHADHEGH